MIRKRQHREACSRQEECESLQGALHGAGHTASAEATPARSLSHPLIYSFNKPRLLSAKYWAHSREHTRRSPHSEELSFLAERDNNKTMDKQIHSLMLGGDRHRRQK